jgi:radical SAM protein with 4Fe4S-binding SPASM domain
MTKSQHNTINPEIPEIKPNEHPLEKWLQHDWFRYMLRRISKDRTGKGNTYLERGLRSYGDEMARLPKRLYYWPIHTIIDHMRGSVSAEKVRGTLQENPSLIRAIMTSSQSVARLGLSQPQRWLYPLHVVWHLTERCTLSCRHCYQASTAVEREGELSREEKLTVTDELGRCQVASVLFSGGEPLLCDDIDSVIERCAGWDMYTALATHGAGLRKERCETLAEKGLRYVEVSLDYTRAEDHDRLRGVMGSWKQAVEGIRNAVETPGLRVGIAMCLHRDNRTNLEEMVRFAIELGADRFVHYDFIPAGRGREMLEADLNPEQREEALKKLSTWKREKAIEIISTSPQFTRLCQEQELGSSTGCLGDFGTLPGVTHKRLAPYLGGCGAGRTIACIQANGQVTPCAFLPDRVMGTVKEKGFREIIRENPWWDLVCNLEEREGHCGQCTSRTHCGGCRARAEAYYHRLDSSDPGCINNVTLWQQLINEQTTITTTVQNPIPHRPEDRDPLPEKSTSE